MPYRKRLERSAPSRLPSSILSPSAKTASTPSSRKPSPEGRSRSTARARPRRRRPTATRARLSRRRPRRSRTLRSRRARSLKTRRRPRRPSPAIGRRRRLSSRSRALPKVTRAKPGPKARMRRVARSYCRMRTTRLSSSTPRRRRPHTCRPSWFIRRRSTRQWPCPDQPRYVSWHHL
jgi:hypothetical protein